MSEPVREETMWGWVVTGLEGAVSLCIRMFGMHIKCSADFRYRLKRCAENLCSLVDHVDQANGDD